MLENLWRILERAGTPMQSFAANFGPEQFVWTLPDIHKGAIGEKVARAP